MAIPANKSDTDKLAYAISQLAIRIRNLEACEYLPFGTMRVESKNVLVVPSGAWTSMKFWYYTPGSGFYFDRATDDTKLFAPQERNGAGFLVTGWVDWEATQVGSTMVKMQTYTVAGALRQERVLDIRANPNTLVGAPYKLNATFSYGSQVISSDDYYIFQVYQDSGLDLNLETCRLVLSMDR
jgi:hypothetical protein